MKIRWCFVGGLPQFCDGRLESQTSNRQKFGPPRWFSVVFDGLVEVEYVQNVPCSV